MKRRLTTTVYVSGGKPRRLFGRREYAPGEVIEPQDMATLSPQKVEAMMNTGYLRLEQREVEVG